MCRFFVAALFVAVVLVLAGHAGRVAAFNLGGNYVPTPTNAVVSSDYFGTSVASSGSTVAVGAPQCNIFTSVNFIKDVAGDNENEMSFPSSFNGNGYVAMYTCTGASGACTFAATYVSPSGTLNNPSGSPNYYVSACFGASVALTNNGGYLVVGSPTWG